MHGPGLASDGFLGRLKSHKVIQWTLAYAALAYTLLHGVEMVSNALGWPHLISRILTLLLILGAPIVALLAWYHGARQLKRVSGPELIMITLLGVIAGSVLWAFSGTAEENQTADTGISTPVTDAPAPATTSAEVEPTPTAPRTAVAVLPFANLTGDASKDYLGDGMADELINTLAKVSGLKVPARTSTFAYKDRSTDVRQIAKDLGVGTVVEGSVRAAGKRIRITVQLINAQDGLQLWSESYDEEFTDIFKLQDKLANAIALALEPQLADVGPRPVTQTLPTQDVEAYDLNLQGWSLVGRGSLENLQRAIAYFNQALARDPKFAQAYAGMAEAYVGLGTQVTGTQASEALAAAERAARKALELDANLAYGHMALGSVAASRGQPLEMESHDRAALSLAANDGLVHILRAVHSVQVGHVKEGFEAGQRAYALAPANPLVLAFYAGINTVAGRDAEASRYATAAVDLGFPKDRFPLPWVSVQTAQHSGHYAEAVALYAKITNDTRVTESARLALGALENPAQRAAALTGISRQFSAAPAQSGADTDVNVCLLGVQFMVIVGGLDEAYALANRCLSRTVPGSGAPLQGNANVWLPEMRAFRRDARFSALVTRLGLMEYYRQIGPPDDCEFNNNRLQCQ